MLKTKYILALIFIFSIFLVVQIYYSFSKGISLTEKYTPMIDAAMYMHYETALAHHQFEQCIVNQEKTFDRAIKHIEKVEFYANIIINGGKTEEWLFIPFENSDISFYVREALRFTGILIGYAKKREGIASKKFEEEIKSDYVQSFHSLHLTTEKIESTIQQQLFQEVNYTKKQGLVIIFIFIIITTALFFYTYFYFTKTSLLSSIFNQANEQVVVVGENLSIIEVNPSFLIATGYGKEEVRGKSLEAISAGKHKKDFYQEIWHQVKSDGAWKGIVWNRKKSGEIYPKFLSIKKAQSELTGRFHYIGIFSENDEQLEEQEKLNKLAYYDSLTGLPNRFFLTEQLEKDLALYRRKKIKIALLFLDLDNFKNVNDSLGHLAGDELLIKAANLISSSLRESDIVARFGGDEFIVALLDIDLPRDVIMVSNKIIQEISKPFLIDDKEVFINASIGITIFPDDADNLNDLIKNGDTAMYQAKGKGKGCFAFYTSSMEEKAKRRMLLDTSLRSSLSRNEIILLYQPQVLSQTGEIIGTEVLIRWDHPQQGIISPAEFIPLAEQNGFIIPIGEFVLLSACRQLKKWHDLGYKKISISVNFSVKQFQQPNLIQIIKDTLEQTGLEAKYLKAEITESLIMKDVDKTTRILNSLKEMGIQSSIDDFGTGYSSLSYLKHFPIRYLKIDKAFVTDIEEDSVLAETIINLAKNLQLEVVAEGIETIGQNQKLLDLGCSMAQGFYFGKPLASQDFEALLITEKESGKHSS
ncbi:MAG: EAL domain-containing protein [Deltaproteobacteria bacterium]|nr:EAL domain-containing protein [Deltaproteobacteria bacterium]